MYEDSYDAYCDDLHDYSLKVFYERYKRNPNFEDEKDQELFQVIVDNAEGTKGFFDWCDKQYRSSVLIILIPHVNAPYYGLNS